MAYTWAEMQMHEKTSLESRVSDIEHRLETLEEERRADLLEERLSRLMLDPSVFMSSDERWGNTVEDIHAHDGAPGSATYHVPGAFHEFMNSIESSLSYDLDDHAFMAVYQRDEDISYSDIRSRFSNIIEIAHPSYGPSPEEPSENSQDLTNEYWKLHQYILNNPDEAFDLPDGTASNYEGWKQVADCLVQTLHFMQEEGSLVSQTRKTFDGLMNGGKKVLSVGKRGFDTLVGKTVKKSGPVNNADRARAIGKWIGIATPELLPLVGIPLSGGSKLALSFILAFDPVPDAASEGF
jgi:hypothetical protein